MADEFELNQQIIYAEEFGPKNYDFFRNNIALGVGSWMKDLSQLIEEKCRDAIICVIDDKEKVIEVVRYLVKQNDVEKYKMFIDIWREHAPAKATQFERALLKRIEEQSPLSIKSLYQSSIRDGAVGVNVNTSLSQQNKEQLSRIQYVKSSQLLLNFIVGQLKSKSVNTLSVFNDKLLITCYPLSQLFIYSREGRHLSTISINDDDKLYDAIWTPRGNIVYTTCDSKKVVVMSEFGKVIATHTQMIGPRYFSVSKDDNIYLADWDTGVYESNDDGVSWNLVFKSTDGWHCLQVVKVIADHSDDFWTMEWRNNQWHLRVYSVDKKRFDVKVKDINVTTTDGKYLDLTGSGLSYDGYMNIFLSDYHHKAVHVLSVNDQHHCKILASYHTKNIPERLSVDLERQLLYVGQLYGVVEVFKLTKMDGKV